MGHGKPLSRNPAIARVDVAVDVDSTLSAVLFVACQDLNQIAFSNSMGHRTRSSSRADAYWYGSERAPTTPSPGGQATKFQIRPVPLRDGLAPPGISLDRARPLQGLQEGGLSKVGIAISLVVALGFGACVLLPERFAVNAPIQHMLFGRGTDAPTAEDFETRIPSIDG